MRKLGLIGGMSWVSTRTYYEHINRIIQLRRDPHASAPMLLENLDFTNLRGLTSSEDWDRAGGILVDSAKRLADAGVGALLIGANSMHKVYDRVAEAVDIPVIHIAECVGERMGRDGVKTAALIGSSNVMTESFYRERLVAHGVDLLPPDMKNTETLDRIIYNQLTCGKVTRDAQRALKTIITVKAQEGARAIVLACTELELVVDVDANVLPIYDCTRIHAEKAAAWILGDE
ncbi:aspartate racemase [Croceicoccus estronivorus]|uniref:aspartate/glutamate racemase family protein n=1 Tax=Croceicoccus estronivorus TaxID=1172626 RepID=UPI000835E63B|nr:amino acid racemase [Croceicoccus estronivorus]OCC22822.1 aspartate racemase [Croceicoccus estronivorus]